MVVNVAVAVVAVIALLVSLFRSAVAFSFLLLKLIQTFINA